MIRTGVCEINAHPTGGRCPNVNVHWHVFVSSCLVSLCQLWNEGSRAGTLKTPAPSRRVSISQTPVWFAVKVPRVVGRASVRVRRAVRGYGWNVPALSPQPLRTAAPKWQIVLSIMHNQFLIHRVWVMLWRWRGCLYIYIYIIHSYIYIYIYRERERYCYIYIYILVFMYSFIYVFYDSGRASGLGSTRRPAEGCIYI